MQRRQFLVTILAFCLSVCCPAYAARRHKFVFKIRTKTGGIIGGITIEAKDIESAKYKLKRRYPDCEIMEAKEK